MSILPAYVSVPGAPGGQKRALDSLGLELQMIMSLLGIKSLEELPGS